VIRLATPLHDEAGRRRGLLVLNFLGETLLRKLAELSAGFAGSALLINGDGYFIYNPDAPESEWAFMTGGDAAFGAAHQQAWASVVNAKSGQLVTDEGLFTFKAYDAELRPERGLVVVAHVPTAILYRTSQALATKLLQAYAASAPFLFGLLWYLAYNQVLRRRHEQRIEQSEARLRALSAQLLEAQEQERGAISRDLHDDLGQLCTAINLDLERAAQAEARERKDRLIGQALAGTHLLLDRMRDIAARLRPSMLDDLGLKDAVQSLLAEFEQHTGIAARSELRFDGRPLPGPVSENLYRILQEALTNVARHAKAETVSVQLDAAADPVRLTVRDQGVGFDTTRREWRGLGMLGMQERVELLGGTFRLWTEPGRGTEIHVEIPAAKPGGATR
jgi:signal transduction histidine kinase